jgi:hypothetical protein
MDVGVSWARDSNRKSVGLLTIDGLDVGRGNLEPTGCSATLVGKISCVYMNGGRFLSKDAGIWYSSFPLSLRRTNQDQQTSLDEHPNNLTAC